MSRTILVLQAAILVVTLLVTWSTSNAQASVLSTTERISGVSLGRRSAASETSVAFLRVVQGIERAIPRELRERLTPEQLHAIYDAVAAYRLRVGESVTRVLTEGSSGTEMLSALEGVGKDARREIETTLEAAFRDPDVVSRLTAEVLNSVR